MIQDPHKIKLYMAEGTFWQSRDPYWSEVLSAGEITDYSRMLFTDGIARPYYSQIRRAFSPVLEITEQVKEGATAYRTINRISYHPTFRTRSMAMHEVAHMLTPELRKNPHDWRFIRVYVEIIARHFNRNDAGILLTLAKAFGAAIDPVRKAA